MLWVLLMNLDGISLAQYVARLGGIRAVKGYDNGEIARVREVNKCLRGKNSIVRPSGTPVDECIAEARGHGYSVEYDTFLDLLTEDAWAIIRDTPLRRVFATYEDPKEWSAWEPEPHFTDHCSVCGIDAEGANTCPLCHEWASASVPMGELTWEHQEIMIEAIEGWL